MEHLKNKLGGILEIIPPESDVVFLDYPFYFNFGDFLIMLGTERFFKDNKMNVVGRYCIYEYPLNLEISSDTIFVFQGGGNFGDLYPWHQRMREYFVKKYSQNRIVFLPQTVYFQDEANLSRTSKIFGKHPDLYIFVRDLSSRNLALTFNFTEKENIRIMPDMAHYLWPIKSGISRGINEEDFNFNFNNGTKNVLFLLRNDIESRYEKLIGVDRVRAKNGNVTVVDWKDMVGFPHEISMLFVKKMYSINKRLNDNPLKLGKLPARSFWYFMCNHMVRKSIKMFSGFSYVVSSRLHGHILSCLIGIPNTLIDNSYGKNSGYFNLWTSSVPFASFKELSEEEDETDSENDVSVKTESRDQEVMFSGDA